MLILSRDFDQLVEAERWAEEGRTREMEPHVFDLAAAIGQCRNESIDEVLIAALEEYMAARPQLQEWVRRGRPE